MAKVIRKKLVSDLFAQSLLVVSLLIVLQRPLTSGLGLDFFKFSDEVLLLAVFGIGFLFMALSTRVSKLFLTIVFVFFWTTVVSLKSGFNPNTAEIIGQNLLHLKFFLFFWAIYELGKESTPILRRLLKWIVILGLGSYALEFLLGETFLDLFGLEKTTRNNKERLGGFFHPNQLSLIILMGYFVWFYFNVQKNNQRRLLFVSIVAILLITSIGSRMPLIGLLVLWGLYYKDFILKKAKVLIGILIGGIAVFSFLAFYTDFIEITIQNLTTGFDPKGHYIRGIMLTLSLQLSWTYFPLGTGSGTFGSYFSKGSVVYEDLGVAHRSYFIEMDGVYDSNIATLLGEFGWLGLAIFLFLFYRIYRMSVRTVNSQVGRVVFMATFFFLLLSSFINPIFSNSVFSLVIPLFIVYLMHYENSKNIQYVPK